MPCSFAFVSVAAADSTDTARDNADFVCTGVNDETVVQSAIDLASETHRGVYLYDGTYRIDSLANRSDNGPRAALVFPHNFSESSLVGQSFAYGRNSGVRLYVTPDALSDIGDDEVDVIRTEWCDRGIGSGSALRIENIAIHISDNTHAVRAIDLRRCDRPELKNVYLNAYRDMQAGLGTPPPIAKKGCIGLTMTDGSNASYSSYENVLASGFYEGIQVGGEHVLMLNCGTIMNYYGFTFGNYDTHCGSNHPITLIQCYDERNVNLPFFADCGDDDGKGGRLHGGQEVSFISFNIERIAHQTPGGVLGDLMREVVPGRFCGKIDFTAQPDWCHTNDPAFKLWASDGSGSGFTTRNMLHKNVATTKERLSYYPNIGQQIYDTDLGKMLVCVDADTATWVDMMGNPC